MKSVSFKWNVEYSVIYKSTKNQGQHNLMDDMI